VVPTVSSTKGEGVPCCNDLSQEAKLKGICRSPPPPQRRVNRVYTATKELKGSKHNEKPMPGYPKEEIFLHCE